MSTAHEKPATYHPKRPVAVLDACVLFPNYVRDVFLSVAKSEVYHPKWSLEIQQEWTNNLEKKFMGVNPDSLRRTVALMNNHFPDALTSIDRALTKGMVLPDINDLHVLSCAIAARATYLVTFNLRDFPSSVLQPLDIRAIHPDDFLIHLRTLNQLGVEEAIQAMLQRLKKPPLDPILLADKLKASNLPKFAQTLY